MGMTIDEARHLLISGDPYSYKFSRAVVTAIDTMRKYQKIEAEILRWVEEGGNYSDAHMLFIKEIIDRNDD